MLHRQTVATAAQAKLDANLTYKACAAAFGLKGAAESLNAFYAEMDALIATNPFAEPAAEVSEGKASREEVAIFNRLAARAR